MLARFGHYASIDAVDGSIRAIGFGSSLDDLDHYIGARGLAVERRYGGTWDELKAALQAGHGVIVTYNEGGGPHTVMALGMFTTAEGREIIRLQNDTPDPETFMSRQSFEQAWSKLYVGQIFDSGIGGTYALVDRQGTHFAPGGSALSALQAISSSAFLEGLQATAIGVSELGDGELGGGALLLSSGVVQTAAQMAPLAVQGVGALVEGIGVIFTKIGQALGRAGVFGSLLSYLPLGIGLLLKYAGLAIEIPAELAGAIVCRFAQMITRPMHDYAMRLHKEHDVLRSLQSADANGTVLERQNFQRLQASTLSGKAFLVRTLLSAHLGHSERAMLRRVLDATAPADRVKLEALVGKGSLEKLA